MLWHHLSTPPLSTLGLQEIHPIAAASVVLLGIIGHAGLVIAAYNRVNATGISRITIKRYEKLIVLLGTLIPGALLYLEWPILRSHTLWEHGLARLADLHPITFAYLLATALFSLVGIPVWFLARPCFSQSKSRFTLLASDLFKPSPTKVNPSKDDITNRTVSKAECFTGKKFSQLGSLPRNEISWTEANRKRLILDDMPEALTGLTIAHISDIHFTGQMSNSYYDRAIQWINAQSPDLIVIAGDIVDYAHALDRIEEVLGRLKARHGKFFVLGNHDRRLSNPLEVCDRLEKLQWIDLGKDNHSLNLRGVQVELLGNEQPWFSRHSPSLGDSTIEASSTMETSSGNLPTSEWKIGVAHSPDQFDWAVRNQCGLLLCGHTHGGQIRFPWVGPLIAPSWHGSRFASGVFYRNGTVMHVSRGLSGVHPFRWGCPPEISILELAKA